jgi:iron complex outermembrane receptor protein
LLETGPLAGERERFDGPEALAIYGSDAIGGVSNFILRKDYRGAEVSAQYTSHEHTGGYGKRLNTGSFAQVFSHARVSYCK